MTTMMKTMTIQHGAFAESEDVRRESVARNLLLFFAAPWIGLGYIVAFPFVGFWALLRAILEK